MLVATNSYVQHQQKETISCSIQYYVLEDLSFSSLVPHYKMAFYIDYPSRSTEPSNSKLNKIKILKWRHLKIFSATPSYFYSICFRIAIQTYYRKYFISASDVGRGSDFAKYIFIIFPLSLVNTFNKIFSYRNSFPYLSKNIRLLSKFNQMLQLSLWFCDFTYSF